MKSYKEFFLQFHDFLVKFVDLLCWLAEKLGTCFPEEDIGAVVADQSGQHIHWPEVIMGFCFASALQMATLWSQLQSNFAPIFDAVSIAILLSFTSIFVSKYIASKFPRTALVLEHLGVLFAVTGFFVTVTISFPKPLVVTTWVVYVTCLFVIIFCNIFY
ncbi:hypothetical protein PanWU01x14_204080 [Parasponia andersonii]|uniref:Uncharacterized protein n=1 Tax=Parasponia andersonii TaxID=3476 RepID=A0A2P5BWM6_PARAD|nr:hypothetical protein PanWU01x14_204080 [Parasponia andersonii]